MMVPNLEIIALEQLQERWLEQDPELLEAIAATLRTIHNNCTYQGLEQSSPHLSTWLNHTHL